MCGDLGHGETRDLGTSSMVGTCGTGTRGMLMIIAKVGGKCDISFFMKMCYLWYNNRDFSQTLSSVLSAVYMTQRDYLSEVPAGSCKVCKSLSIALIILFTSAGRAVRVDSRAFASK